MVSTTGPERPRFLPLCNCCFSWPWGRANQLKYSLKGHGGHCFKCWQNLVGRMCTFCFIARKAENSLHLGEEHPSRGISWLKSEILGMRVESGKSYLTKFVHDIGYHSLGSMEEYVIPVEKECNFSHLWLNSRWRQKDQLSCGMWSATLGSFCLKV